MAFPAQRSFDAVIIGAGGAGMRASLELAKTGKKVALVSKVFPTRSHTVSAQGGITVSLGNKHEDNWQWHMFDTVKGSDYLGDQDCIEYMCQIGPEVVYELEHMGLPFSRFEDGKIYQRPFGGQSKNFGGEQATRTAAAADRTGHALLHTLFQKNVEANVTIFSEWYAIDLVKAQDGAIAGVTVLNIENGDCLFMKSKAVILATGGAGQIFHSTTNALINTGDGIGMVLRAGFAVQDMEMWQFHPTGIAGAGVLVTEGCRGEGGYLVNKQGERFMERYAPHAKDLAGRDVVSRAMAIEIREGRGCGPQGDHVLLKLDHLGAEVIKSRLPGIRELSITFANVDPIKDPIPVVPTCHYMMGGIPTNVHGQVLAIDSNGQQSIVSGLYAVGECACVSVHGANRLGGNSLLDLVVFGRAAGLHVLECLDQGMPEPLFKQDDVEKSLARLIRWDSSTKGGERLQDIRHELKKIMQNDFSVFRTEQVMVQGVEKLKVLRERLNHATLSDKSKVFNTARIEALELDNLMAVALASAVSALYRKESRGAHSREDYPKRDDQNWLKHTVYFADDTMGTREVNMKPRTIAPFELKERVY
ncbi:MAG: succinate dehydrogenase flavoprotein subunit [Proteobacteria bacterium]|nr:succinate dehydrogenase flavoprotein subunit [Pseudomonadota bacterium]